MFKTLLNLNFNINENEGVSRIENERNCLGEEKKGDKAKSFEEKKGLNKTLKRTKRNNIKSKRKKKNMKLINKSSNPFWLSDFPGTVVLESTYRGRIMSRN